MGEAANGSGRRGSSRAGADAGFGPVRLAEHPAAVDGERGSCPGFYSLLAGRQGKIKRLARPLERLRDGHPADLSRGHLGEYEVVVF